MDTLFMTQAQQSEGQWLLGGGQAVTLDAAPVSRVIAVTAGRVWLTRSADGDVQAPDVWLAAGESAALEPGEEVVLEAWPHARFAVLESSAAAPRRLSAARAASWARALRARLQWAPRPALCA
jgi:hypothetical protein